MLQDYAAISFFMQMLKNGVHSSNFNTFKFAISFAHSMRFNSFSSSKGRLVLLPYTFLCCFCSL